MGRIPEATIQEIRERVDIVGLISRYVDLKKAGRSFKGRCPFHEEKTPSFNVNPDRQAFYCFGCQVGGSAITFLMKHENLTFPEAARSLASEHGIEIPESESGERGISEKIYTANQLAQDFYRTSLAESDGVPARKYLEERGVDAETIEQFGIGYAPNRWDGLHGELKRKQVAPGLAVDAGLLVAREGREGCYDRLRGRVVFPICDVRGRIAGFGGRAIFQDQQPKYLNTPESPVFHKRNAFYGFPQALEAMRKTGRAVVCEGYFDRIALARAGMGEAVATCGTALTEGHGTQLARRVQEIVLLFDGDIAGQNAIEKALEALSPTGLRIRAALLPAGEDPDSFLRDRGGDALRTLVDRAPDAIEVVIQRALGRGYATPAEKSAAVNAAAPFIALVRDPVERIEWARRLALVTDADPRAVEDIVHRSGNRDTARSRGVTAAPSLSEGARNLPAPTGQEERHLRQLAQLVYRMPTLLDDAARQRIDDLVPDGSWKSILFLLAEAADEGRLDRSGSIDLFQLEDRLDDEATGRLHSIAVDDMLDESETPESVMLGDLLEWFARRRRKAESRDLTRRLRDPDADEDAILAEKQQQLEKRRAAHRVIDTTVH